MPKLVGWLVCSAFENKKNKKNKKIKKRNAFLRQLSKSVCQTGQLVFIISILFLFCVLCYF